MPNATVKCNLDLDIEFSYTEEQPDTSVGETLPWAGDVTPVEIKGTEILVWRDGKLLTDQQVQMICDSLGLSFGFAFHKEVMDQLTDRVQDDLDALVREEGQ